MLTIQNVFLIFEGSCNVVDFLMVMAVLTQNESLAIN